MIRLSSRRPHRRAIRSAAAFWGNEPIREVAMKSITQPRRAGLKHCEPTPQERARSPNTNGRVRIRQVERSASYSSIGVVAVARPLPHAFPHGFRVADLSVRQPQLDGPGLALLEGANRRCRGRLLLRRRSRNADGNCEHASDCKCPNAHSRLPFGYLSLIFNIAWPFHSIIL